MSLALTLVRRRRAPDAVRLRPTGAGWAYLVLVAALFLMAVNYSNNLIHALAFLLAAFAIVGAWRGRGHLAGIELRSTDADPVFAGDTARLPVWLEGEERPGLYVSSAQGAAALQDGKVGLAIACPARGRKDVGRITLATRYPLGLVEARREFESRAGVLVYPRPAGTDWPPEVTRPAHQGREAEDFAGLRPYAPGDSPRRLAWKAVARGLPPQTKLFDGAEGQDALILDWADARGDAEARLGELARWVLHAHDHGLEYALKLPARPAPPGRGEAHRRECLAALALHGVGEGAE